MPLSQKQKILQALYNHEVKCGTIHEVKSGTIPWFFSPGELVVRVWESDTRLFGLPGYFAQYPNSHKIYAFLMGKKGLVQSGLLLRNDKGNYVLTDKARNWVQQGFKTKASYFLKDKPPAPVKIKKVYSVDAELNDFLSRVLVTAFYEIAQQEKLTKDASYFAGVLFIGAANTSKEPKTTSENVVTFNNLLKRCLILLEDDYELQMIGGRIVTEKEIDLIGNCFRFFLKNYS